VNPTRFLADVMLARLARWLRVLGVDVASAPPGASDRELVRIARDDGRTLLTRDRGEEIGRGPTFVVRSDAPLEQLREVASRFGIAPPAELFTRCLLCNAPLDPPRDGTRRCPVCGRDYWEGSHTRRMRATLARLFDGPLEHDAAPGP
jgi:uncharacterized protein with PIN domain